MDRRIATAIVSEEFAIMLQQKGIKSFEDCYSSNRGLTRKSLSSLISIADILFSFLLQNAVFDALEARQNA